MFYNRISEKMESNHLDTPKSRKNGTKESISERKLATVGLLFSLVIVAAKLYYVNYETIEKFVFERKLVSYTFLAENGQLMFTNTWETAIRFSKFWFPLLCGFLVTYFTWMCVYLDSNIPGVNPPSPLSPQKIRRNSGHTFHLNYVFAVLVGILVTAYMYIKGISIQY